MLLYILLLLLIFICILVVRALLLKPEKMPEAVGAAKDEEIHEEDTVRHMQALIRCRTVSSSDPEKEDPKEFDRLTGLLPSLFPNVHKVCEFTMPSTRSLVFRWKGKDSSSSAVLMAHYDVVPVHEPSWSKPPFDAIIEDGVMWGRGTIDTKSTFLGILEAADTLIREGYQPQHDLYLCFSGTEEVNGFGAPAIVRYLKEKGIRPSFVLDEGGAVVSGAFPSVRMRSAVIGIAEKGTMAVRFSVPGAGGHASTPPSCSSIRMLSDAVHKVETHPFPVRISDAARATFRCMGSHASFPFRVIFANTDLLHPLIVLICRLIGGEINALTRTTTAFTQMEGSEAFNVMPSNPWIGANVRINVGETTESVIERLKKIVNNPKVQIECTWGRNPSPVSLTDGDGWEAICSAVSETWDDTFVSPYLMLASSDSWHYSEICDRVYRFSPMIMSKEERRMIHGNDERLPIDTLLTTVRFFKRLMRKC